ncbi:hypothetical protein AAEU29_13215 [Pseudoalteromonas sp. SSM20]|uniref:hypothetical protein n=1 Tax=Pseudoalteromonas sp. SSM20 TaxID=3139394 RepID=UPI003BA93C3F
MQCVTILQDGTLQASSTSCDFVIVTHEEYLNLGMQGLANLLTELFAFDLATFSMINASCFVAFIVGHSIGRVVRTMGKA